VTRVGIENSRVFLSGFNNGLIRRFLSQGLEVFGKVKGTHKGQHIRPEAAQARVITHDVADYIVNFYNAVRLRSKLGNL
jgi:hypothetical protein